MKKENVKKIRLLDNIDEVGLFRRLNIFEDIGIEAKPTDLVLLTGGIKDDLGYSPYWTRTTGHQYHAVISSYAVSADRHESWPKTDTAPSIRPILEIKDIPDKAIIAFGEYPQFKETNKEICDTLTKAKNSYDKSFFTGKSYCLDGETGTPEYEYNGERYVPVVSKTENQELSDGTKTVKDELYWVKVSPVIWYVDKKDALLISLYTLLSGINYWFKEGTTNYEKESNMCPFLESIMFKDITDCKEYEETLTDEVKDNYPIHRDINLMAGMSSNVFTNGLTDKHINERILEVLKNYKYAVEHYNLSKENKKIIADFISRKHKIEALDNEELKNTLMKVLYYDLIDYETILTGSYKADHITASFNTKMQLLLYKAISQKVVDVDFGTLKEFLNQVINKTNELCKNDRNYLINLNADRWYLIKKEVIDPMIDTLTLNDPKEIQDSLKQFSLEEDDYNDALLSLDLDMEINKAHHNSGK